MDLTLKGKTAIVTGASRGIGAEIALNFARRGAKVCITFTSQSSERNVDQLIQQIKALNNGASAIKVRADLRDLEAPLQVVETTTQAFGDAVDILVNNAGFQSTRLLEEITVDDFNQHYDLNVRAVILMTKAVLPKLRKPGRIINISSTGSRQGFKGLSLYCSSKAAVEGLTRCYAAELGAAGHTVNAVNPGPVATDLLDGVPDEIKEGQKKTTPVENRLGTTDDIAQIVGFLAEERSRWVTGQAISATGGWSML